MIYFKSGVYAAKLRGPVVTAINIAHDCMKDLAHDLTITSLADGRHMPGSLHYKDLAIDIRTRLLTEGEKQDLATMLKARLGSYYDVVVHSTHIHIEYDP
jgi:hypothetical protein